jgi:hypothetical protein
MRIFDIFAYFTYNCNQIFIFWRLTFLPFVELMPLLLLIAAVVVVALRMGPPAHWLHSPCPGFPSSVPPSLGRPWICDVQCRRLNLPRLRPQFGRVNLPRFRFGCPFAGRRFPFPNRCRKSKTT